MKKNYMKLLAVLLVMIAAQVNVMAQNRKTNMELKMVSPAANATIANGANLNVSVTIKNLGPDALLPTDTMVLLHSALQSGEILRVAIGSITGGGNLAVGATSPVLSLGSYQNNNTGSDQTADFCTLLLDVNRSNITLQGRTSPLQEKWDDTDTTNNRACAKITLKGKPVGLFDVDGVKESLVMGPNPANREVSFLLSLENTAAVRATVRDIQGREVMTRDYGRVPAGDKAPLKLDVSGLRNGIYLVELNSGDKKSVGKLVVQH
ncbi:T9SS type A sorting domain-containing protein [Taibaiella chishuiensis]|uniref:Putative secreted protein (Por secretion system target) n=1 Tax=Taibaiella chishuiensis TaxID=1434707 RepID=A0A2P8D737_9BACT|nr:T9SS type A sorting domain-containing protein [Taibaiella chishuiensis]PSK93040.1 putative secreted protein (Por secretion system target) [Taibaiella chishuiensis]